MSRISTQISFILSINICVRDTLQLFTQLTLYHLNQSSSAMPRVNQQVETLNGVVRVHNRAKFINSREDSRYPYPSAPTTFIMSNTADPIDSFDNLYLNDLVMVGKRVARKKLARMTLSAYQRGLFSRGVQLAMDPEESYNGVLDTAIGYAGAVGITVMDELESTTKKVVDMDTDIIMLQEESVTCKVNQETFLNRLVIVERDQEIETGRIRSIIQRQEGGHRELLMLKDQVASLTRELGQMRDNYVCHVMNRDLHRLAVPNPIGQLVEIIDVDEGDEVVGRVEERPQSQSPLMVHVRDFTAEEEEQAGKDEEHLELLRAIVDPAPEYTAEGSDD